ncbi:class I SAM-dependent methyltransferase [Mesorhizobium sp. CA12]|uniref:class I SAM-dependent methyltransferase n=1 Tax=Mesorhizobium sp. CA12 TaxID=2876644 RepID=UPI001CCAF185|nr:class I SAM-dependent methyltransferase [Mesorhizobium sp. CA12]MBZ9859962.1 hypothetical protein [Mesorhizobium sp. CA12]
MTEHWNAIRKHWQLLGSPLRPPAQVVEAYERELELSQSHVVMLGVTPELAGLGATMTAVDESPDMIAGIWPGDTDMRKAVQGDWFDLPFPGASIEALIGDGCLSVIGAADSDARCSRRLRVHSNPSAVPPSGFMLPPELQTTRRMSAPWR